jgi:hypothetical protein
MFSNIQEQEEFDHQQSAYRNESQAAYDLSCKTQSRTNQTPLINILIEQGYFCVVSEHTAYCRYTDAILPWRHVILVAAFSQLADAEAYANNIDDQEFQEASICIRYPQWYLDDLKKIHEEENKVAEEDIPF